MSTQLVRTIGKARIIIAAFGCVDCDVERSHAWIHAFRLEIKLGSRREYLTLKRCTDCSEKAKTRALPAAANPPQREMKAA